MSDFNVENTCRTCLEYFPQMNSLFEFSFDGEILNEILMALTQISIIQNDGLSMKICENCSEKLMGFHAFRKMCISSDESARRNLNQEIDKIKQEVDSFCEDVSKYDPDQDLNAISFCTTGEMTAETDPEDEILTSRKAKKTKLERQANPETEGKKLRTKKHFCDICNHAVESPSKLLRHMKTHEKSSGKKSQSKQQDLDDSFDLQDKQKKERNKKYVCPICELAMEAPSKLKRHLRSHMIREFKDKSKSSETEDDRKDVEMFENKTYSCPFCTQIFNQLKDFYDHLKHHDIQMDDESVGSLNCNICKQKFNTETAMERHHIVHTEIVEQSKIIRQEPYYYTCIICSLTMTDYDNLFAHMRSHKTELENKEIQCQLCPKKFSSIKNIIRHASVHEENATHQCIKCNRKYGMGEAFIDHMLVHQNLKPFSCKECGKNFLKFYQLKNHLKAHSDFAKPHLCQECGKSFSEADYLNRHLKRHSGIKPYACPVCPKTFTFKYSLSSHMVYHSKTKAFYCETCGSNFASNETLRKHQRIHSNDKRYQCDQCPMKFTVSSYLARHMRTHTGEKPYVCSFCQRSYAQSNDLVKHMRIHVGQNTYKCEFENCTAAFRLHGSLKEHLLLHYKAMKETGNSQLSEGTSDKILDVGSG